MRTEREIKSENAIKELIEIKCEHYNPNDYYLGIINCDALGGECKEHYCSFKKLRHFVYNIYNNSKAFNPLKQEIARLKAENEKLKKEIEDLKND